MIDPRVEELLERLYLEQVEDQRPSTQPDADDLVVSAERSGLVHRVAGGTTLTEAGRAVAASVVRRHRLAECLLVNVLAVKGRQVDSNACRFEHIVEPALEEKMCSLLGHPTTCPHGRPIPPGPCCRIARRSDDAEIGPLSKGRAGGEGTVVFLSARDQGEVAKLMAMGILPGEHIRLLRTFPSYVFQVGMSQFTVDRQLAQRIQVRWEAATPAKPRRHRYRRGQQG